MSIQRDAIADAQPSDGSTAGKGAVFIGIAKIYFMLSGFVQQVLLTRLIDLADYGAFAVVNNTISIVNNTVVQATIQSVSKFTAEDDSRAGAVQRAGIQMQVALGAVLALAIVLGAPLLADFVGAPRYTTYFRIAAAIPFLYALYAVFIGSANGLRRFRTQANFDIGFSTAKTDPPARAGRRLEGDRGLHRLRGRCDVHSDRRFARDAAAGQPSAVPTRPAGSLHGRGRRLRNISQPRAELRPTGLASFCWEGPRA